MTWKKVAINRISYRWRWAGGNSVVETWEIKRIYLKSGNLDHNILNEIIDLINARLSHKVSLFKGHVY